MGDPPPLRGRAAPGLPFTTLAAIAATWTLILAGIATCIAAAASSWEATPHADSPRRCAAATPLATSPYIALHAHRLSGTAVWTLSLPYTLLLSDDTAAFDTEALLCSTYPAYILIAGAVASAFAVQAAAAASPYRPDTPPHPPRLWEVWAPAAAGTALLAACVTASDFSGGGPAYPDMPEGALLAASTGYHTRMPSYPWGVVCIATAGCACAATGGGFTPSAGSAAAAAIASAAGGTIAVHALALIAGCAAIAAFGDTTYLSGVPASLCLVALACETARFSSKSPSARLSHAVPSTLLAKCAASTLCWFCALHFAELGYGGDAAVKAYVLSSAVSLLAACLGGLCLREGGSASQCARIARGWHYVGAAGGAGCAIGATLGGYAAAVFAISAVASAVTSIFALHPAARPAVLLAPLPALLYCAFLVGEDQARKGAGPCYASLALAGYLMGSLFDTMLDAAQLATGGACGARPAGAEAEEEGQQQTRGGGGGGACSDEDNRELAVIVGAIEASLAGGGGGGGGAPEASRQRGVSPSAPPRLEHDRTLAAVPAVVVMAAAVLLSQASLARAPEYPDSIAAVLLGDSVPPANATAAPLPTTPGFAHPGSLKRWLLGLSVSPVLISATLSLAKGRHTPVSASLPLVWLLLVTAGVGLGGGPEALAALCCGCACIAGFCTATQHSGRRRRGRTQPPGGRSMGVSAAQPGDEEEVVVAGAEEEGQGEFVVLPGSGAGVAQLVSLVALLEACLSLLAVPAVTHLCSVWESHCYS